MANKVLVWSVHRCDGNPTVMLPSHYIESDVAPLAVRIYAVTAPDYDEAKFEIYDDGVSIMGDRNYSYSTYIANTANPPAASRDIFLGKGENSEEMAEDFNDNTIEVGSWMTCVLTQDGGGRDFTVVLELENLSESDEESD